MCLRPVHGTWSSLHSGDPRSSLEERYGTHERYVAAVQVAAEELVRERLMLPQDVAGAVAYLCSEDGAYVHGEVISMDGGLFM